MGGATHSGRTRPETRQRLSSAGGVATTEIAVEFAEVVAETARRVAPLLLSEDGHAERLARLRLAASKQTEPGAEADNRA